MEPHRMVLVIRKRPELSPYNDEAKLSQKETRSPDLGLNTQPTQPVQPVPLEEREQGEDYSSTSSLTSLESSVPEDESEDISHASKATESPKAALVSDVSPQVKKHCDKRRPQNQIQAKLGLSKEHFARLTSKITTKLADKDLLGHFKFRQVRDLGLRSDRAWLKAELETIRNEYLVDMGEDLSLSSIDKCMWERAMYVNKLQRKRQSAVPKTTRLEMRNSDKTGKNVPSPFSQMVILTNHDRRLQLEITDNAERQAKGYEKGEDGQAWMADLQNRAIRIAGLRYDLKVRMEEAMTMINLEEREQWFEKLNNYEDENEGRGENSANLICVPGVEFV